MPPAQPPSRPRRPRRPRNTLQSFLLALAMHGLLFAALWFAVQWHTVSDSPAQAELWNVPPPPAIVTPETPPPPPPPPVVSAEPPKPDAEIVEQQQKAKPVPEPTPPPPEPVKPPPKPEPPPKQEPPPPEPVKPPPEPVKPPPEPPKKPPEPKRDVQREKLEEKLRQQEIERTLAGAGPSTNATNTAAGGGSQGEPGYAGRIKGCIKPNIVFDPTGAPPDTQAEFEVDLLPDGSQAGAPKMTKPSGLPAYDAAVDRAIRKCDPFPRPDNGPVPRSMHLTFRPTD
jgi:colicin import membrane protein